MQNPDQNRHQAPSSTRSQRRVVDLEAPPAGPDQPIHNIAVDLEGAPQWRLWATVAILGVGTTLALLAT